MNTLKLLVIILFSGGSVGLAANAAVSQEFQTNIIEELDPFSDNVEEQLKLLDQYYEMQTGESSHLETQDNRLANPLCYRQGCQVWAKVVKSEQRVYFFISGKWQSTWLVSTGAPGHSTPNFDTHPNGRIYNAYTSLSYPSGDYMGLGNMPYAVFISGAFAIHGTPQGNWPKLGTPASHGCVRVHPDGGYYFNRLVRAAGVSNTWITVMN
ncbi:MAG: L,D-transpeptidase [Bdellovibrionota bacterium]